MGRHYQAEPQPSVLRGVFLAGLLALVVALGGVWIVNSRGDQGADLDGSIVTNSAASSTASQTSESSTAAPPSVDDTAATSSSATEPALAPLLADAPATAPGAQPCTTVPVLTSLENADLVRAMANAYAAVPRDVGGHCVTVTVTAAKSGLATAAVAAGFPELPDQQRPAMWMPDSSAWFELARRSAAGAAIVPAVADSVAQSPIVVAMPEPLATAIGWRDAPPTWAEVFAAAGDPTVWSDLGHPEWGSFKLGKTSPLVATSGLFALVASYGVATGSMSGLTAAQVTSPSVVSSVTSAELAVSHYMATPEHFLWHAREAANSGSAAEFLSATIVDEKSVWDYNRGLTSRDGITKTQGEPPAEKLVPIYPTDGSFVADNPAAVLNGAWVGSELRAAAADFQRFTGTREGQSVVRSQGYRAARGDADPGVAAVGGFATSFSRLAMPSVEVLTAAQQQFPTVRKRARVLFLIDVSGSMGNRISPELTKLQAAKDAVRGSLRYLTADDDVALAAFSNFRDKPVVPGVLAPMAPLGTGQAAFLSSLDSLVPVSQTPLYAAVSQFTAEVAQGFDPSRINVVVLLSDGRNDTTQPKTLADLTTQLHALHDSTPVLVFTLAYGADADTAALQQISGATGAHYYDATDPTKVGQVLGDLVTSF